MTDSQSSVTIVFLVYNRREELRKSLGRMVSESDYDSERVDVIVVDNASSDDSAEMVRQEFPQVQLIVRDKNIGASAWNEGFAVARGDYVLVLDDDCYLLPDGLTRAVAAAEEHEADLVSFSVVSTAVPGWLFTDNYRTGLFSFWGCAVLIRRQTLEVLGGYDPEIFIWANELEFTLRFFDRGFKHLHFPEVVAQHMKHPGDGSTDIEERGYRLNARHFGYIAGKLLRPCDAAGALLALSVRNVRDGLRVDRVAYKGVPETVRGFAHGLRHHQPVRHELSRFYRRNFETFASPWWLSRPAGQVVRALPRELVSGRDPKAIGREDQYYKERAMYYPEHPRTLKF